MDMQMIQKEVNQALITGFELKAEDLKPEAHVFQDLGLDSLDAVDLIVMLEDSLKVKVNPEDFAKIRTLQDTYNYIARITQ